MHSQQTRERQVSLADVEVRNQIFEKKIERLQTQLSTANKKTLIRGHEA